MVLLPYRFTLFSNEIVDSGMDDEVLLPYRFTLFSNLRAELAGIARFYYLIDLHYSQTRDILVIKINTVLLPYRFTLFSNRRNQNESP